jgi:hypothetical protein
MELKDILIYLFEETKNLNSGEEFIVRDLYKGYEWNRLDRALRLNIGKAFMFKVDEYPEFGVEKINKNKANQQLYRKK